MARYLTAADLAKPREHRRLAAVVAELAHGLDQRGLHDVLGVVLVAVQARQGEAEDARKIYGEELAERAFLPREHLLHQFPVFGHFVAHCVADQLDGSRTLKSIGRSACRLIDSGLLSA